MTPRNLIAMMALLCYATGATAQQRFSILVQGDVFVAQGVIDHTTPGRVAQALRQNPGVTMLVLTHVPGSNDDEANLQAARLIRQAGLTTFVPEGGLVASGGTDLFLAGQTRAIGPGACIGVHSWAAGGGIEGRDVPPNHPDHQLFLRYYAEMGIPADFYWYTLDIAGADDMHYMAHSELRRYRVVTAALPAVEADAARCDRL